MAQQTVMKRLILLLALIFPLAVAAQNADYYRVLLPVFFPEPLPGAYGSAWKTAYAVNNPTPYQFHVDWCPGSANPMYAVCTRPLLSNAHIRPGETETTLPPLSPVSANGGPRLLYIQPFLAPPNQPAPSPASLSFALRAFDVSRSATNAGTEVPVVRQEMFRKATTSLLNVPTSPNFRLTLRVYETSLKTAGFTIRVYDQSANALLGEKNVVLSWPFENQWPARLLFEPAHLQIGDITELLLPGTTLPPTLRIEIEPRTPGSEFWAFVSITNNETQHLTLVTPQ